VKELYEEKFLLKIAEEAARAAAEAARKVIGGGQASKIEGVGASGDTTLRVDKTAEEAILRVLENRLGSGYAVLSEEQGYRKYSADYPLFIIDPIDGSYNVKRGLLPYAVSIAIAHGGSLKDVAAGVVLPLNPSAQPYKALKGEGAFVGDRKLTIKEASSHSAPSIAINFSASTGAQIAEIVKELLKKKWKIRGYGCGSLEVAWVTEGLDASLVLGHARVIDYAAAMLIVKEAGGTVLYAPKDARLSLERKMSLIAAKNAKLAREIAETTKTHAQWAKL